MTRQIIKTVLGHQVNQRWGGVPEYTVSTVYGYVGIGADGEPADGYETLVWLGVDGDEVAGEQHDTLAAALAAHAAFIITYGTELGA